MDKDIRDLPGEIWKTIEDFPDYEVSNLGRIKSSTRYVNHNYGGIAIREARLKKIYINSVGYNAVGLMRDKKVNNVATHRLIAKAFIPNSENKPQVNHKDGNKLNNSLDNLEWVTSYENIWHGINTGLTPRRGPRSKDEIRRVAATLEKKTILMDTETGAETEFDSATKCAESLGVKQSTVSQSIRRGSPLLKKFRVRFANAGLALDKETIKS